MKDVGAVDVDIKSLDDSALIELIRSGDQSALEELFQRYRRKVFSLTYRMTGNTADAEDLCQEVFVQVIRKLDSFQGRSSFSTWLYRVAMNRSRDFLRTRKRAPELVGDSGDGQMPRLEVENREDTSALMPEDGAIASEAGRLVHAALQQMPLSLRTPLVLHELEGLQYREVARILRLPVGTVKSRIFRARVRLAELLESHKEQWS